jgi:hypothetical protein
VLTDGVEPLRVPVPGDGEVIAGYAGAPGGLEGCWAV